MTALAENERTRALARLRLLRPYLEHGVSRAEIARDREMTPRSIERWIARYRAEGLAGLALRSRADSARHRVPDHLRWLIEELALERPRRSVACIRRKACEVARREGRSQPGYKLVRSIVRGIHPAQITLAHEGHKAYRQGYDLIHCTEWWRASSADWRCAFG